MKVLMINSVCGIRSTGRICAELAEKFEKEGHVVKIAYGREEVPEKYAKYAVRIGSNWDLKLHGLRTRLFDAHGFGSKKATERFLEWAEEYNPDLLWLHNIHGYYLNLETLFTWVKSRPQMQVKWTLHDCWAFTGHCSHFTVAKCEQWKTRCLQCVQKNRYPASKWKDNCKENFDRKRAAFTGVKNMTIVSPSKWLANLVKQSFLQEYPVEVCYNTIDKEVFKRTPSDFRERYGLEDKKMVLGVATAWDDRKGLDDFIAISKILDEKYKIVLVGLSAKQIKALPATVVGIARTNDAQELAAIYTAADVFLNLSREETFGLTTVEALACGTKVIVYKDTACEEIAAEQGGMIVEQNLESVKRAIEEIC